MPPFDPDKLGIEFRITGIHLAFIGLLDLKTRLEAQGTRQDLNSAEKRQLAAYDKLGAVLISIAMRWPDETAALQHQPSLEILLQEADEATLKGRPIARLLFASEARGSG